MSACLRAQSTGGLGKAGGGGGGADAAPRKRLSPGRMQGFREGADEGSRRRSSWRLFPGRGREERGGFFVQKTSPSPSSPKPESLQRINSSVWGRSGFSLSSATCRLSPTSSQGGVGCCRPRASPVRLTERGPSPANISISISRSSCCFCCRRRHHHPASLPLLPRDLHPARPIRAGSACAT